MAKRKQNTGPGKAARKRAAIAKRLRREAERMGLPSVVPAVVAFFLRTYGGMVGRKEIHRLLNERVLDSTGEGRPTGLGRLPEDGVSTSASNQLWDNVERVHRQLVRTMHSL